MYWLAPLKYLTRFNTDTLEASLLGQSISHKDMTLFTQGSACIRSAYTASFYKALKEFSVSGVGVLTHFKEAAGRLQKVLELLKTYLRPMFSIPKLELKSF